MEKKLSFSEVLKKYTMVIVLVLVVIMFTANTKGVMLLPQNVNNLVAQNAYVFILATGMLFCILTGGNIDLSVGSVVCFVAAVGGKMMVLNNMNPYLTMLVMLITGIAIGAWQGFWIAYVRIPPFIVTLAGMLAFRGLIKRSPYRDRHWLQCLILIWHCLTITFLILLAKKDLMLHVLQLVSLFVLFMFYL